jgi:PAS domain S-box-containing protein
MTAPDNPIAWLNDARLSVHALSPSPVWLWSADAGRVLWANPVAAAIFDAPTPAAATRMTFDADHVAAAQVKRLAGTLPQGDMPRLERLRGFGASLGGTLICLCSRFTLADNTAAVLVVATERAGKVLALPERARRLLLDAAQPAALFSADGEFVDANEAARKESEARDLSGLGADALAREATLNGRAEGEIAAGSATVLKLGAGPTFLLLVLRPREQPPADATAPVAAPEAAVADIAAPAAAAPPATDLPASAASDAAPGAQVHPLPLRFVWQMNAANRFTQGLEDFTRLLGPKTASVLLMQPWSEAAATLKLDPRGEVTRALASQHTWSGIVLDWPRDAGERLPIEMSGLPVFDRDRQFAGFRGFAICRDPGALAALGKMPLPAEAAPVLSPVEHSAFEELRRTLDERLKGPPAPAPAEPAPAAAHDTGEIRAILDKLPAGVLVYRLDTLLYANRAFLGWTGHRDLEALNEAGGLDSLFIESTGEAPADNGKTGARRLAIATAQGRERPVEARLFSVPWNGEPSLMLTLAGHAEEARAAPATDAALARAQSENRELMAILDTATDGVLVLDGAGRVVSANRSAQALFGREASEFTGLQLADLFAPESRLALLDYLERAARGSGVAALDAGRDVIAQVRHGGLVPLSITLGRIDDGGKLCAVLRDVTAWKRGAEELVNARHDAERASTAKSEFLAKISHEIRTPLNAIIGFSEVMMEERFGPVGNDRYRQYLKDIRASGAHLISLINDLLDLSKIEAGKLDLTFVGIDLNELTQQCVGMLQEEANRERVIVRSSLAAGLPPVIADARSVRQIALNVLSNSIKFTGAGGQVIVSTALNDDNHVVLRVRDTGRGMSEKELETALEPFRQLATSARWGASGTGLGLPITKALAEANHARFRITSRVDSGTLVEIAFPAIPAMPVAAQ